MNQEQEFKYQMGRLTNPLRTKRNLTIR